MKKKLLTLLLGTSLVMGLAACGGGSNTSKNDNKGNGTETAAAGDAQKIYNQHCSSCHGNNLEGKVGPKISDVGSRYSKEQILDILKNGKGNGAMPKGLISGDDADKVATWLAAKK